MGSLNNFAIYSLNWYVGATFCNPPPEPEQTCFCCRNRNDAIHTGTTQMSFTFPLLHQILPSIAF